MNALNMANDGYIAFDDWIDRSNEELDYLKVNIDKFPENMSYIKDLVSRTKTINIMETPQDEKYTSYTVNKGEKIVFCLRDKDGEEKLVKENIMMFVSLHELAHLMTESVGHEPEFWDNFRILLRVAISNGLYKHIDFNKEFLVLSSISSSISFNLLSKLLFIFSILLHEFFFSKCLSRKLLYLKSLPHLTHLK